MEPGYELVEDAASLEKAARTWKKNPVLAVDLEMENNLHRYGTHLALIQISDGKKTWIVDPLKVNNLRPFVQVMEDRKIQKIFHDADFDFRILDEKLNCHPKNIFDTKLAAELDGRKEFGLGPLLQDIYGVEKDTKCQKYDWMRRPLSNRMLEYASKDVKYLIQLRDNLKKGLDEKGRRKWYEEEFKLLENIRHNEPEYPHLIRGSKTMTGRGRAILHRLFDVREKLAKRYNRPSFHLFNNKMLLEFAKEPPSSMKEWSNKKGVSWIVKKNAKLFADAVRRGKRGPEEELPEKEKKPHISRAKFDYLKEERNRIGNILEVEPYVVISVSQMEELVRGIKPEKVLKKWQQKVLEAHGVKL